MHSSKCVVLDGFNGWRNETKAKRPYLLSGYLYRTRCHRHGTGCIHRKGQTHLSRISLSGGVLKRNDADSISWKFSIERINPFVRKKKKKEYWLSSTLFKKWCHPRRYLGLGNELNRIVVIRVTSLFRPICRFRPDLWTRLEEKLEIRYSMEF